MNNNLRVVERDRPILSVEVERSEKKTKKSQYNTRKTFQSGKWIMGCAQLETRRIQNLLLSQPFQLIHINVLCFRRLALFLPWICILYLFEILSYIELVRTHEIRLRVRREGLSAEIRSH